MTTFVDTNVLIWLLDSTEELHEWSVERLEECKGHGPVIVSDIVYCEFSIGMQSKSEVDIAILQFGLERIRNNDEALFRAGRAYKEYRSKAASVNNSSNFVPTVWCGSDR